MLHTIRVSYGYSEIDPSVSLMLYFRMIGVYVTERFLNQKIDVRLAMAKLEIEKDEESNVEHSYDAEIYLIGNLAEYEEYKSLQKEKDIVVLKKGVLKEEAELQKLGTIIYDGNMKKAIDAILHRMRIVNIISAGEELECTLLSNIYALQNIAALTLKSKFFFAPAEEDVYKDLVSRLKTVVNELGKLLDAYKIEEWGQDYFEHAQYAMLNMAYETNLYCKRNEKGYVYSPEDLLEKATRMSEKTNCLGKGIQCLRGQICADLLLDFNKAYEQYMEVCDTESSFNAYTFFLKGQYWQNFGGNYDLAIRYYKKSIALYPEYYRAWYMMGYCYNRKKEYKEALTAFDAVHTILSRRLNKNVLRPLEIQYYFLACVQCAQISNDVDKNVSRAISYYQMAERVGNAGNTSGFIKILTDDVNEQIYIRNVLKRKVDCTYVYEQLYTLYKEIGYLEDAEKYKQKMYHE